jgi:hypothetical protein
MLQIDLQKVMSAAFGTQFVACVNLAFHASMRLARCWFADEFYGDIHLPKFLRTLKNVSPYGAAAASSQQPPLQQRTTSGQQLDGSRHASRSMRQADA